MASSNYLILPVKTRETMASEYSINVRTLRRWLRRERIDPPSGPLNPKWQKIIYETFGPPPCLALGSLLWMSDFARLCPLWM